MIIDLPDGLASSLRIEVLQGHFPNPEEAVARIVREYLQRKPARPKSSPGILEANDGLGSIGAMRDDAELLDQAVAHAMFVRENRPWILAPVE